MRVVSRYGGPLRQRLQREKASPVMDSLDIPWDDPSVYRDSVRIQRLGCKLMSLGGPEGGKVEDIPALDMLASTTFSPSPIIGDDSVPSVGSCTTCVRGVRSPFKSSRPIPPGRTGTTGATVCSSWGVNEISRKDSAFLNCTRTTEVNFEGSSLS